ncbi:MAG: agmatinase, partial [Flavobacteriaceae bacterium]|nr:agmatinase [Flavobacteriaceae bacterium]
TTNLIQVGIRSMDQIEQSFMDPEKTFFAHDMVQDEYWSDKALELMTDNVFITLDLDAFDPSILPATGTPEPGGLLWYETLAFLKEVFAEKNVVGFDIVELCPNSNSKPSEFLAAKLYYKMLSYKFMQVLASDPYDNTFDLEQVKKNTLTKFQDSDE